MFEKIDLLYMGGEERRCIMFIFQYWRYLWHIVVSSFLHYRMRDDTQTLDRNIKVQLSKESMSMIALCLSGTITANYTHTHTYALFVWNDFHYLICLGKFVIKHDGGKRSIMYEKITMRKLCDVYTKYKHIIFWINIVVWAHRWKFTFELSWIIEEIERVYS